jgi:hypothetical protein
MGHERSLRPRHLEEVDEFECRTQTERGGPAALPRDAARSDPPRHSDHALNGTPTATGHPNATPSNSQLLLARRMEAPATGSRRRRQGLRPLAVRTLLAVSLGRTRPRGAATSMPIVSGCRRRPFASPRNPA